MNQHDGVLCHLQWAQKEYKISRSDRVLQKTPLGCDFSVWEIFLPLLAGAQLTMARPGGHQDPHYLIDEIERREITTMFFVPSLLNAFVNQTSANCCPTLRRVLCSGEALPYSLQQKFLARLPDSELHNLYGPTEAATDATFWRCVPQPLAGLVPIGRPLANTKIYILDAHDQPVPVGIAGEIHIGGKGVARGYLHRPDLTASRFVADPFVSDPNARMYKTGDLGRWTRDGDIEYLGRNDFQVKIRGFRVEPEEIEIQLSNCEGVRELVVIAREDVPDDRRLVAYLTPKEGAELSPAKLRRYAVSRLPEYMIPSAYVVLDSLPLNTNGKLDRGALPVPDGSSVVTEEYEAPEGDVEVGIAELWRQILRTGKIGRHDQFFDLGGDSLLGIKLIAKVAEKFGVRLPVATLYQFRTINSMAQLVQGLWGNRE
jgi:acyl-CoA synthetase (AMP-forming)/AMP-acid ligase II/acyl carrier protein